MSIVVAEPEIGGGGGGCAITELHGQVIVVHECKNERGVFYRILSDGPVEILATETRITGPLILAGDLDVNGDVRVVGATHHDGNVDINGAVRVKGDVRARDGCLDDPLLEF